jgi:hypothetical protein
MHILRALVGFLGLDGWFPNFVDLANTNAQNPKVSLTDFVTLRGFPGGTDGSRNWGSAVLFPEENKVFITPAVSAVDTNHGNRGLIYNIATDTYTQSNVVFPNAPQFDWILWSSILLKNGKALITVGRANQRSTQSYYLYDIKNDSMQSIGTTPTHWVQMVKLPDDRVYMLGSSLDTSGNFLGYQAQIYNSDTNTFTNIPGTPNFRNVFLSNAPQLILLPSGQLLIVSNNPGFSSYFYNPNTNSYTATSMPAGTGSCLLADGRVFVVRGLSQVPGPAQDSNGYIWNPNTGTTQTVPNASIGYFFRAGSVLLPDGRIAVAYSATDTNGFRSVKMVDPVTLTITDAPGGQTWQHGLNNAIMMPNGKVLIVQTLRPANNKFHVLSGEFSNGVQYPLRQYQGAYLNDGKTLY